MVKRIYNFEKIRGVDVTSSPINVASNRASYMVNMINEGGVNKKRHGWRDVAWFEDSQGDKLPINGIFEWQGGYVVHAGTHFYECGKDFSVSKELELADGVIVTSTKSKGYVQDGKLWIVGAGEYLVYDGNIIQPVMNSVYAYIPTTSIGITANIEGEKTDAFQGVNLFTKKRINKLVGVKNPELPGNENIFRTGLYRLDGMIDTRFQVKVTLNSVVENRKFTRDVDGADEEIELNGEICIIATKTGGEPISVEVSVNGEIITGCTDLEIFRCKFYNKDGNGYIEFGHPLSTPILEGDSNITVEYTADYESDIMISTSGEVSLRAGVDVLALTNHKNVIYFSDFLYGYGYFPDNDYIGIGKETEPITAIVPLESGEIGVFKQNEYYGLSLAVNIIDEDYVVRLEPSVQAFYPGIGCDNEFCGLNVNGDTLIYNSAGVHGVISSASKPVNMRSTNVNRELCAYSNSERESAFAVSHEGRYYLFIGDKVYIADTRFKTYESNRLDSGFEYEWWIWTNCECRCAYSYGDVLYMGTDKGEIRAFYDGYVDEKILNALSSRGEMVYNGAKFTFSNEFGVSEGDTVSIHNAFEKLCSEPVAVVNGADCIQCTFASFEEFEEHYPAILPGDRVMLFCEDSGAEILCEVQELQPESLTVLLGSKTRAVIDESCEYILAKEPSSYKAIEAEDGILLMDAANRIVQFAGIEDIWARVKRQKAVACELRTGAIDFYKLHSKTLLKLALTPSEDTVGEVEIGYETNLKRADKQRFVGGGFDFKSFDFKSFVFDGNFSKTFVKRVFERNFNYIIFKFASKGDGPFGIENAQAVYSINNELRGDL